MRDTPRLDELADDDDLLDGCEVDMLEGAITDHEVLEVVFGDDPKVWEEYRLWFQALGSQTLPTHEGLD